MILADTSVWIEFLSDPGWMAAAERSLDEIVTCGPVVQEVLQGFAESARYPVFRERLLAFPCLGAPTELHLYLKAADLYREGRRRGYTIRSAVDCLIAAIAIENGVPVWHRDRDFTAIARYSPLRVYNPS